MVESTDTSPGWERQVLEKVALAAIEEQRRARRWGIFFKLLAFLYLFLLLFLVLGWIGKTDMAIPGKHSALVELRGIIAADERASADVVVSGLRRAFKDKNTAGVILRINSPGGSPVQAAYINNEIKRLRKAYPHIPLYAVVEDVCASGGYYAAVAADKIFVNRASIVGSIGVLIDGFGFSEALNKLGIERRLLAAGENKGFLDPFSPMDPEQRAHAMKMLEEIHRQFIEVVREGRGERLKETPELFSGLVWTGARSIELGLADDFASAAEVAREVIKAEEIVDFTPQEGLTERLARRFGAAAGAALMTWGAGLPR
ncbi:MAG: S49 family peptidase [Pseudomonadota bacterium]